MPDINWREQINEFDGLKHLYIYDNLESAVCMDEPNISYYTDEDDVKYNMHNYSKDYLTITSLVNNNTIKFKAKSSDCLKTIQISIDNGQTWESKESSTAGVTLAILEENQKLLIKGNNTSYAISNSVYNYFSSSGYFDIEGNISSLIYMDNFINQIELTENYALSFLFYNCTKLKSAKNLILPFTILSNNCYSNMFYSCTSLTNPPKLLATILSEFCYSSMFSQCTALTKIPNLPAIILPKSCYQMMFYNCINITSINTFNGKELGISSCYQMFDNCSGLTTIPELNFTSISKGSCQFMFQNCTSLQTIHKISCDTLADSCFSKMFFGCTGLTTINQLNFKVLAESCCGYMFQNCTSLTSVINISYEPKLVYYCFAHMFNGCTSLTSISLPACNILDNGVCSNMFINCTSLVNSPIQTLPATTLANFCYASMFSGCTSLITTPQLPSTILEMSCYSSMFKNCISLTTAPELPATTLKQQCYDNMFYGCTNLNYIKCLATNISASSCVSGWVTNVASNGTFIKAASMESWPTGNNGIPSGWTVQNAA